MLDVGRNLLKRVFSPPAHDDGGLNEFLKSNVKNNEILPPPSNHSSKTKEIQLTIVTCENPPKVFLGIRKTEYYMIVENNENIIQKTIGSSCSSGENNRVIWEEVLSFPIKDNCSIQDLVKQKYTFKLMVSHRLPLSDQMLGTTTLSLGELTSRDLKELVLEIDGGDLLLNEEGGIPTTFFVSFVRESLPIGYPPKDIPVEYNQNRFEKHVMIFTRGTKGDIQPFVALAVGLSEHLGWLVTICTEIRYAENIKTYFRKRRNLPGNKMKGAVRFRPSGGDTMNRVDSKLGRWALRNGSDYLQMIMMGKAESEFFSSEPVLFHYAKTLKPNLLIFGFTMANISMIISEALQIPVIGFMLQPTCIPSVSYPPLLLIEDPLESQKFVENETQKATAIYVKLLESTKHMPTSNEVSHSAANFDKLNGSMSLDSSDFEFVDESTINTNEVNPQSLSEAKQRHVQMSRIKTLFENNPFSLRPDLNYLRTRRNLEPMRHWRKSTSYSVNVPSLSSKTWSDIVSQNIPLIVPINPFAFGGKPHDWNENTVLTDFIYLPQEAAPSLKPEVLDFISKSKENNNPIVAMGFSSMPVPKKKMLEFARTITTKCTSKPNVIALIGAYDLTKLDTKTLDLKKEIEELNATGRVLVVDAANFQLLFKLVDCTVIHGGLGTTADALFRNGKPTIVTGVLLMDQRFWAQRVHSLGAGPSGVYWRYFGTCCAELIDFALRKENPWALNAKLVADTVSECSSVQRKTCGLSESDFANGFDEDGVILNAIKVAELAKVAKPYKYSAEPLHHVLHSKRG